MTLENSSAVTAGGSNTTAAQPATTNFLDRFLRWLYYVGRCHPVCICPVHDDGRLSALCV